MNRIAKLDTAEQVAVLSADGAAWDLSVKGHADAVMDLIQGFDHWDQMVMSAKGAFLDLLESGQGAAIADIRRSWRAARLTSAPAPPAP